MFFKKLHQLYSLNSLKKIEPSVEETNTQKYLNLLNQEINNNSINYENIIICDFKNLQYYIVELFSDFCNEKKLEFVFDIENISDYCIFCDLNKEKIFFINLLSILINESKENGFIHLSITQQDFSENDLLCYEYKIEANKSEIKQEKIEELFVQYHKEINFEISELNLFSITFKQNFKKAFVDKSSLSKIISTSDISNDVFAGMKVLIVEDDKLSRDIAVELLGELKIKCDIACDGIEALEKITIKKNRYDIILMDIQMPRMDGYKTTKKIRILKDKDISKVPIIAMTANVLDTDKQKAYECGMNGYIPKPIVIDRIKNEFVKVLQQ